MTRAATRRLHSRNQKNYDIIEKVASIIGNEDVTQKAEALASRSGTYDITDKVYTFKNGHALFLGYGAQAIAFYLRDMNDDYGILPYPKYDTNQTEYYSHINPFFPVGIAIPGDESEAGRDGCGHGSARVYFKQRDAAEDKRGRT